MTTQRLTLALVVGLSAAGCSWNLGGSEGTAPPTILSVDPPLGNNATDVRVTVIGTGYFRLLVRDLNSETGYRLDESYRVTVGGMECRNVVRVDDDHLLATVPAGLAEGPHDVVVTSPALLTGLKEQGYYATSAEAPVLTDVSPRGAVNDAAQVVTVSGTGLRSGAQLFAAPGSVEVVDITRATPLADDPAGTQTATSKQVIVPAGLAAGPYTLAVKNPDGQRAQLQDVFQVADPARLQLTLAAPPQVSVGQTFNVTGALTNGGGSDVLNVVLDPAAVTGAGGATVSPTSTPPSADVPQGGTGSLVLTAQATQAGTLSFSTRAAGSNAFSLRPVTSATATSNQVVVQRAAALTASVSVSPATAVSVGQSLTVTMTVQNTGEAAATGVTPSALVVSGGGNATVVSGPSPASVIVPGGTTTSFNWQWTATAAGPVIFSGNVSGTDLNTTQAVSSATASSAPLQVQTPAQLSIISFALPGVIARGQSFSATMVIVNVGQAAATGVRPVPSPPATTVTGGVAASTSTAITPASIPGGGSATFSWTYTENGTDTGTLALVAAVIGSDANSMATVTSMAGTSNTASVQPGSDLRITSFDIPSTLTTGQTFTATLTVQNFGGTTATGVLPAPNPPTITTTGGANATTSSTVLPAVIPPSGTATFVWSYTVTGTGTISFITGATGLDAITNGPVNAAATPSNGATVVAPSGLTITSFSVPTSVSRGQTFTATMRVQNNGGATAQGVVPDPPTVNVTGGADAVTSTSQTPVDINPGNTATFTWTYTENGSGPGTIQLSAGASGTDALSGNPVFANPTSTNLGQVQDPARLQVSAFTVPTKLSRGQAFNAVMTVRNLGQAQASNVLPSPAQPSLIATGGANASTPTTVAPQTIPGGGQVTFTWAYTENGGSTGTLKLNGGVTGTDANSGSTITGAAVDSVVATVEAPARLQVTSVTLPPRVARGQAFTAQVAVTNLGDATATGVLPSPNPPSVTGTGGANATSSSAPPAQNIAAGQSATFLYSYTENGTGTGTIRLATGATGTDANSGAVVTASQVTSAATTVETPAALSITSFTLPANLSRGSTFSAVLVVTNTGQATATGVLPSPNPPTLTVGGGANASTPTTFTPVDIPGGGTVTFTWTYTENGASPGTLRLATGATGTDADNGAMVTAAPLASNIANVLAPGVLLITAFTLPATITRGQTFQASMTVQNNGTVPINNVLPSPAIPTLTPTGGANAITSSTFSPVSLAVGASTTFTWTYLENGTGTGTLTLTGGASGNDAFGVVSANPTSTNLAQVQTAPSLSVTSLTLPPRLSRGQTFTVSMVVSNSGQAAASNVRPSPDPLTPVVTGGAAATTSTTHSGVTIAGGATATITWTYTENGTGTGSLALRGGATGTDANSGASLTAGQVTSAAATVEQPASLQVSSFTIPANLSRGQNFSAVMVVTNNGQAQANGVLPAPNPPTLTRTGGANAANGTGLTAVNIAGGASATFTWTYTENGTGTGTLALASGAAGTDANSGSTVNAAPVSTITANVVSAAALASTITGPTAAVAGDQFTVKMVVTNSGQAQANAVTPSALTPTVTGVTLSLLASPSPAPIPGGGNATFVWTYSTAAGGNGTVRFSGNASGTDANSGTTVSSTTNNSNTTNIVTPAGAGLTSAIVTKPRTVPVNGTVTVELAVTNRSAAARNGIVPSDLTLGGTGQVTLLSGPAPATMNLLAGQNGTFSWTYRATAPGWVTFAGNATSTAPQDASARTTSPALAIPSSSCSVSTLVVNAGLDRTITSCNQNAALGGTPTASGGNPSYVYEWTPITNVSNPAFANPTASPKVSPATYTVTVTDGDGCRVSDSMVVTVTNMPVINTVSSGATNDRRCTGNSFTFSRNITCTPAGGCNNLWVFGDGTANSTQNGPTHNYAAAGTYYVNYSVTDNNGCRASRPLPVFVGAAGVLPVGPIQLTPAPPTVAADGAATVTFTSQALSDCNNNPAVAGSNMRFLVDTDRGTITNADVDGATAGIQVAQSAAGGGFGVSFTVRADRVGGVSRVRAQSVLQANSQARGWGTTTFTGSTSLPQVAEATPEGKTTVNPTRLGAAFTKVMNAGTVIGANVTLRETGAGGCANPNGPTLSGTVSYLGPTQTALFVPGSPLDVLTRGYFLRMTTALRDPSNNALDGNFNQAANGSPADDATFCFGNVADATLPTINCTSLLPAALSADGDGTGDTSTFTATLGDSAALKSWRIQVLNEATGKLVRTLSKVRTTNGADTQAWDGKDDLGQVVPNGNYVLSASALDSSDNRSLPCSLGLTVSSVLDSSELSPPP